MEYFSDIKNGQSIVTSYDMDNLEDIILSERRQSQKTTNCMVTFA